MSDELKLELNHVYSAKRSRVVGFVHGFYNDRMIIHLGPNTVQYDSPTVRHGSRYPKVTREQFLRWAKEDVTEQTPEGSWRVAE